MRMKTENSKLSETAGKSSGQVRNVSTGFVRGLRAKCDHKVLKRGLSTDCFEVARMPRDFVVRARKWAKMRMKTESSKLSETAGENSGQVRKSYRQVHLAPFDVQVAVTLS